MSLDPVSMDTTESQDIFEVTKQQVLWNYHGVKELDEKSNPAILHALSAKHETRNSLSHRKETIKPMMSGGGKVTGDLSYSEKEGFKGEIKIEFDLGPKDTPNNNDNSSGSNSGGNSSSSDIDSSDQDSDKN